MGAMRQELPVTSYALLGLLTLGDDLTGYELKQRAHATMRFYWVAPATSQVYSELQRLAERGLVRGSGPARGRRYTITDAGEQALREWIARPAEFPVLKHSPALRLMVGAHAEPGQLREMLTAYADQVRAARADLAAVRASLVGNDAPDQAWFHPSLVADWGLAFFDSELAVTERTLARLPQP